jgi:hypothetical protein
LHTTHRLAPKRWQDVAELIDAGIDVYTTLNVQHWESLNDVVAQITGRVIRETVPDTFLRRADEIELVDLPPEDLLQRLREGKVYRGGTAERAADSFFAPAISSRCASWRCAMSPNASTRKCKLSVNATSFRASGPSASNCWSGSVRGR